MSRDQKKIKVISAEFFSNLNLIPNEEGRQLRRPFKGLESLGINFRHYLGLIAPVTFEDAMTEPPKSRYDAGGRHNRSALGATRSHH
jgi:hypothetical protein